MSSWRSGRRSPAATWSTIRPITEAPTGQKIIFPLLPGAATPPGQCPWSSQTQDVQPADACSSPWSRSCAGHPWWTPPYLQRNRTMREGCGLRLRGAFQRLTCSDIVDGLGRSDCCFSKFPANFSTNSRLKTEKINCLKTQSVNKHKLLLLIFIWISKVAHKIRKTSSLNPQGIRCWHDHSPPVLLRWSSDVSSGRCSLSQTGRRRYRACLRTPEPPRVCSGDKLGLFKRRKNGGRLSRWINEHTPWILHKLLHQHHVVVEGFSGFPSRRLQLFQKVCIWPRDAHTLQRTQTQTNNHQTESGFIQGIWPFLAFFHLPASTSDCFNHDWVSYLGSLCLQPLVWLVLTMVTANDGNPSSRHDVFRCAEKQGGKKQLFFHMHFSFLLFLW